MLCLDGESNFSSVQLSSIELIPFGDIWEVEAGGGFRYCICGRWGGERETVAQE